jgi:hypothetical protein
MKINQSNQINRLISTSISIIVLSTTSSFAQIVPDGATSTQISTNNIGAPIVQIAPANPSGMSYNSYTDFNTAVGICLHNAHLNILD